MVEFFAALSVFLLAHVIPARPSIRQRLVAAVGERAYLAAYSLLSLALLAWVIWAAYRAPYVGVWTPQRWHYAIPLAVMPIALVLLTAGFLQANPLSVALRRQPFDADRPGIVAVTRHPILWGFALWGASHVPPNGDVVSLILFGGATVFAGTGMWVADRRARRSLGGDDWKALAGRTSVIPFAAVLSGRSRLRPTPTLVGACVLGLVLFVFFIVGGHQALFGKDPLAVFR